VGDAAAGAVGVRSSGWSHRSLAGVYADEGDRGCDRLRLSCCFTGQMRSVHLQTVIAAPIGDCFGLSLSVDAHAASMRASGEQAIGGVTSGIMKLGDSVTWRARHFGLVFRMTSAITEYQPPERFVDEQQNGPFRRWWHEHTFTTLANGQTQMIDVVQFQSPFGLLGYIADRVVLSRYMPHLLRQRNAWLKSTLEERAN
jgi:ligand-binding SRPBCC domain-containing protein